MNLGLNFKLRCYIKETGDGDWFVGIKVDSENAIVYFLMRHQFPESEEDICQDILRLIATLSEFTESKDKVHHIQKFETPQPINFPVNMHMNIIRYYINQQDY